MNKNNQVSLIQTLSHSLTNNNYDLLSEEVIKISQEVDAQMLPIFRRQLDLYNFYLKSKKLNISYPSKGATKS
ncbi:MAG: hypothetical protein ATN35_07810 [Epulopiscium sp. Nele67-Bin004]|nr:MAG: hypothetical protein ATN35_07810 [Epulopiscium sp. Nele67-Bin004]